MSYYSSTKSLIHSRLDAFVTWIGPDKETRHALKEHAKTVRERIVARAIGDGCIVTSTPNGGSFAKKTGLRRHMHGTYKDGGLDIDLYFVNKRKDSNGKVILSKNLIERYHRYAKECYPESEISDIDGPAFSIHFKSKKVSYDIVPAFATDDSSTQSLILGWGTELVTSVQGNNDFIRSRIKESDQLAGKVLFNECVRLLKWWRNLQYNEKGADKYPSIVLEMLCASAYDQVEVSPTYSDTFSEWLVCMHNIVRTQKTLNFKGQNTIGIPSKSGWIILDPYNPKNNIVAEWSKLQVESLAISLMELKNDMNIARQADKAGEESKSLAALVRCFGSIFESHCIK